MIGKRPPYSLANLRFGVKRDKQEMSLNFHNLGNAKPNLGDIGYVGYAQYSPAGVVIPQVATLQPLHGDAAVQEQFLKAATCPKARLRA